MKELTQLRAEMKHQEDILASHPHNQQAKKQRELKQASQNVISKKKPEKISLFTEETRQLADDLKLFVETGTDLTPALGAALKKDRSLYSRLAQFFHDHSGYCDSWPLELAINNPLSSLDNIHYLVENGAGYVDNITPERDRLLRYIMHCEVGILQYLLDSGYILRLNDIEEIYSHASISWKVTFDAAHFIDDRLKLLYKSSPLRRAIGEGCLHVLQYCYNTGVNIASVLHETSETLDPLPTVVRCNDLDILKFILINTKKSDLIKIHDKLARALGVASQIDNLQIVHYLLGQHEFSKEEFSAALKIATGSSKEYLSYYDPTSLVLIPSYRPQLSEIERLKLEKMSVYDIQEVNYIKRHINFDGFLSETTRNNAHKWLHLALTSPEEEKMKLAETYMPRLTAINRLPPLDPFAVKYTWRKLIYSEEYKEDVAKLSVNLAKRFKHYSRTTSHITNIAIHETFERISHEIVPPPFETISALEAIVTLTPPGSSALLLPSVLSLLVAEYLVPEHLEFKRLALTLANPDLYHIVQALHHSENECVNCGELLVSEHEYSLFGPKNSASTRKKTPDIRVEQDTVTRTPG